MSTRNKQPLEPFGYYHIYNRAVGAERLFYSDRDYEAFMERIPRYLLQCFELYSYCLLPNHFHFCVKTGDVDTDKASKAFSDFSNSYCKWFNLKHSRKGGLFMRPFKRKKLSHDAYFTRIIYYIHRNPVHHRICDKIEDYKYSSYSEILGAGPTIVNRDTVLAWFSGRANFINDHMMIEKEYLEQAAEIWRIEE